MTEPARIKAIDSHTGGEPTRVIVGGFPGLSTGEMSERLETFRRDHDRLRSAVVCEPRGHNAVVGALLCEPVRAASAAGVIFFNNVGYLGMCGHGTMGLIKTLEYMGRISEGTHLIETPVGTVKAKLNSDGSVTVSNVASFRYAAGIAVEVDGFGTVIGDVAYGGNWFFLVDGSPISIELECLQELTAFSAAVRDALARNGISGAGGAEIDHIELFADSPSADSRSFVLCPGLEYDRSPCGTGTSAKLACLYEDGKLKEGDTWRQESMIGSVFEGRVEISEGRITPVITGTAHVTAEIDIVLQADDPYRYGIVV